MHNLRTEICQESSVVHDDEWKEIGAHIFKINNFFFWSMSAHRLEIDAARS